MAFDPNKPFETISTVAKFDPSQPFDEVDPSTIKPEGGSVQDPGLSDTIPKNDDVKIFEEYAKPLAHGIAKGFTAGLDKYAVAGITTGIAKIGQLFGMLPEDENTFKNMLSSYKESEDESAEISPLMNTAGELIGFAMPGGIFMKGVGFVGKGIKAGKVAGRMARGITAVQRSMGATVQEGTSLAGRKVAGMLKRGIEFGGAQAGYETVKNAPELLSGDKSVSEVANDAITSGITGAKISVGTEIALKHIAAPLAKGVVKEFPALVAKIKSNLSPQTVEAWTKYSGEIKDYLRMNLEDVRQGLSDRTNAILTNFKNMKEGAIRRVLNRVKWMEPTDDIVKAVDTEIAKLKELAPLGSEEAQRSIVKLENYKKKFISNAIAMNPYMETKAVTSTRQLASTRIPVRKEVVETPIRATTSTRVLAGTKRPIEKELIGKELKSYPPGKQPVGEYPYPGTVKGETTHGLPVQTGEVNLGKQTVGYEYPNEYAEQYAGTMAKPVSKGEQTVGFIYPYEYQDQFSGALLEKRMLETPFEQATRLSGKEINTAKRVAYDSADAAYKDPSGEAPLLATAFKNIGAKWKELEVKVAERAFSGKAVKQANDKLSKLYDLQDKLKLGKIKKGVISPEKLQNMGAAMAAPKATSKGLTYSRELEEFDKLTGATTKKDAQIMQSLIELKGTRTASQMLYRLLGSFGGGLGSAYVFSNPWAAMSALPLAFGLIKPGTKTMLDIAKGATKAEKLMTRYGQGITKTAITGAEYGYSSKRNEFKEEATKAKMEIDNKLKNMGLY